MFLLLVTLFISALSQECRINDEMNEKQIQDMLEGECNNGNKTIEVNTDSLDCFSKSITATLLLKEDCELSNVNNIAKMNSEKEITFTDSGDIRIGSVDSRSSFIIDDIDSLTIDEVESNPDEKIFAMLISNETSQLSPVYFKQDCTNLTMACQRNCKLTFSDKASCEIKAKNEIHFKSSYGKENEHYTFTVVEGITNSEYQTNEVTLNPNVKRIDAEFEQENENLTFIIPYNNNTLDFCLYNKDTVSINTHRPIQIYKYYYADKILQTLNSKHKLISFVNDSLNIVALGEEELLESDMNHIFIGSKVMTFTLDSINEESIFIDRLNHESDKRMILNNLKNSLKVGGGDNIHVYESDENLFSLTNTEEEYTKTYDFSISKDLKSLKFMAGDFICDIGNISSTIERINVIGEFYIRNVFTLASDKELLINTFFFEQLDDVNYLRPIDLELDSYSLKIQSKYGGTISHVEGELMFSISMDEEDNKHFDDTIITISENVEELMIRGMKDNVILETEGDGVLTLMIYDPQLTSLKLNTNKQIHLLIGIGGSTKVNTNISNAKNLLITIHENCDYSINQTDVNDKEPIEIYLNEDCANFMSLNIKKEVKLNVGCIDYFPRNVTISSDSYNITVNSQSQITEFHIRGDTKMNFIGNVSLQESNGKASIVVLDDFMETMIIDSYSLDDVTIEANNMSMLLFNAHENTKKMTTRINYNNYMDIYKFCQTDFIYTIKDSLIEIKSIDETYGHAHIECDKNCSLRTFGNFSISSDYDKMITIEAEDEESNGMVPTGKTIVTDKEGECKIGLLLKNQNAQCAYCGREEATSYCSNEEDRIENCQFFNENGTCRVCSHSYKPENGDCTLMDSSYCQVYLTDKCVKCSDNYLYIDETCKPLTNMKSLTFKGGFDEHCVKAINNLCIKCESGYYFNEEQCKKGTIEHCADYDNDGSCIACEDGYVNTGSCVNNFDNARKFNQKGIVECEDTFYLKDNTCISCSTIEGCVDCSDDFCTKCNDDYVLLPNKTCILKDPNCVKYEKNKCVQCVEGMNSNGLTCEVRDLCVLYESGHCTSCDEDYILQEDYSCSKEPLAHCLVSTPRGCASCDSHYYLNGSFCSMCSDNCIECSQYDVCRTCPLNRYLFKGTCTYQDGLRDSCNMYNEAFGYCALCEEGYYLENHECHSCGENCSSCYLPNVCLYCKEGYFMTVKAGVCEDKNEVTHCASEVTTDYGCLECEKGYYLYDRKCPKCMDTCSTCNNDKECTSCQNDYVLQGAQCIPYKDVPHCLSARDSKCSKCSFTYQVDSYSGTCEKDTATFIGFVLIIIAIVVIVLIIIAVLVLIGVIFMLRYIKNRQLDKGTFNIKNSNVNFVLLSKESPNKNNVILASMKEIEFLGDDGDKIDVATIDEQLIKSKIHDYLNRKLDQNEFILKNIQKQEKKLEQQAKTNTESRNDATQNGNTNVTLQNTKGHVVIKSTPATDLKASSTTNNDSKLQTNLITNAITLKHVDKYDEKTMNDLNTFTRNEAKINRLQEIEMTNEINTNYEVCQPGETEAELVLGNMSEHNVKIMSSNSMSPRYELRMYPEGKVLRPQRGCVFKVFVKPLCTCTVENDDYHIMVKDMKRDQMEDETISISFESKNSVWLDFEELNKQKLKKLGEGSFGIVYLGNFNGNKVAIKKLKCDDVDKKLEFLKEVDICRRLSSEYLVKFYGACVLIGNQSIVMEYSELGSLHTYIKKNKQLNELVRTKIMLDASKGLEYLHKMGIMHRDIKPDNMLLFSTEYNEYEITVKLTDFGTSRCVDLLLCDKTLTKGLGSPVYMAPEISNSKGYNKSADVYSMAVSFYQLEIWGIPYPPDEFKYPFSIYNFISKGNRLAQKTLSDWSYDLIGKMWCDPPAKRLDMSKVVNHIDERIKTLTSN